MLDVEFAQLTHPGLLRDHNEDFLGYFVPQSPEEARGRGWVFALADGVGGQADGEVASRLAVERVLEGFRSTALGDSLLSSLPRLIQAANSEIYEFGLKAGQAGNIATTIVTCALRFDRAIVAHAGDSRCYLIRQSVAVPLTRDHTVSSEQLRLGLVTAKEAAGAVTSNLLSRALGNNMFISIETSEHQVFEGDVLMLCSDGLYRSIRQDELPAITGQANLTRAVHDLVRLANERDGSDNVSVQLIRVRAVERVGMYRGRHYRIP